MEKNEFIRRAVGLPWVDRACSWRAMDCWGVVMMYFRYVYGEEIPCVEGYSTGQKSLEDEFQNEVDSGKWKRVEKPDGDCIVFMLFKGGVASHVGVIIDGKYALHSAGNIHQEGQVRCDRLESLRRLYGLEMEFYKYEGCRCL